MGMLFGVLLLATRLVCAPVVDPNAGNPCYDSSWCNWDEYCATPIGECLAIGTCVPRPTFPPPCWEPVCGCNWVTYPNGWVAAMEEVSLRYAWACDAGDLDHDGDVDASDLDAFGGCMRGPELIYTDPCMEADTDYDYDVDLRDFIVWQLMAAPPARVGGVWHSACLLDGTEVGVCAEDDTFTLTPSPGALGVAHGDVTYNCCMTGIAVLVDVQADVIHVVETEIAEAPCYCLCCYDVSAQIVNLAPGVYTLRYCWIDQDMDWLNRCYEAPVVIP